MDGQAMPGIRRDRGQTNRARGVGSETVTRRERIRPTSGQFDRVVLVVAVRGRNRGFKVGDSLGAESGRVRAGSRSHDQAEVRENEYFSKSSHNVRPR